MHGEDRPRIEPGSAYIFPRHPREVDRLDIQHYVFRAVAGANFLAPVESPRRILDVGSGTGQWGFDVLAQFPDAQELVGLDLREAKPGAPPRYRSVTENALNGLPFEDAQFDFVHQRLMVAAVPLGHWPALVADLVRVTRPGGWVELVESPFDLDGGGEANHRLFEHARALARAGGLDTGHEIYKSIDGMLRDQGLMEVERRETAAPIGPWGGDVGSLMLTNVRAALTSVLEVLRTRRMLSEEEGRRLAKGIEEEWEKGRMSWLFGIAWGRKP